MKSHHINDTISERASDWVTIAESTFDGSPVWASITPILKNVTHDNYIYGFIMNDVDTFVHEGGRLVHLPGDGSSIPADFQSIILDSVEWLVPRPKGRIVFDLSHSARIGIDPWDDPYITIWAVPENFGQFRDLAVNHSYTFDKLYPSASGNLTAERLAKYDVLVINWPDLDYTAAERAAVEAWVDGGGSLLALGDRTGMSGGDTGDVFINQLIQNFNMSLGTTDVLNFATMTPGTHLTLEFCTGLYIGYRNYLVTIGDSIPLWYDGTDVVVAADEFGDGRAILSADMNIFDSNELPEEDNARFALNALNWLTAADADILAFTSFGDDMPMALRDMGLSYQVFYDDSLVGDFLDSKDWELVIIDHSNQWFTDTELNEIYAYVNDGGRLLMSYFGVNTEETHPLWNLLGFDYSDNLVGDPDLYIWDTSHPIFTEPHDRNSVNFTSNFGFGDDGDKLTVLSGFTALAGSSADVQDGNALIVLKNDYQTLYNGYLIAACTGDEDDSTYRDSIELWQNEITFMLDPPGPGGPGLPIDTTTLLIIGAGILGVVVIGAVVCRARGASGAAKPKKKSTRKKK
jgi:hypothetical protein